MKTNKANANTRKNTKTSKGKNQNPVNAETTALQPQEMTAADEQPIVENDANKTAETASAEIVGEGAADVSAPEPACEPEMRLRQRMPLPLHCFRRTHRPRRSGQFPERQCLPC